MIIVRTPLRLSFVGGGSDLKAFYEKKDRMVNRVSKKSLGTFVQNVHNFIIVAHMSMQRIMQKVSAPQHHLPELPR